MRGNWEDFREKDSGDLAGWVGLLQRQHSKAETQTASGLREGTCADAERCRNPQQTQDGIKSTEIRWTSSVGQSWTTESRTEEIVSPPL